MFDVDGFMHADRDDAAVEREDDVEIEEEEGNTLRL